MNISSKTTTMFPSPLPGAAAIALPALPSPLPGPIPGSLPRVWPQSETWPTPSN